MRWTPTTPPTGAAFPGRLLLSVAVAVMLTWSESSLTADPFLTRCVAWINAGSYPSGIAQGMCESEFELPDPFLISCIENRSRGASAFESRDERACRLILLDSIKKLYSDFQYDEVSLPGESERSASLSMH